VEPSKRVKRTTQIIGSNPHSADFPPAIGKPNVTGEELETKSAEPPPESRTGFLSRGEVAQLFGVSVSTVTRWARVGLLAAVRTPGGHYRFPARETRRAAERAASPDLIRLD